MKWYNNPTLMSFIGVLIGALIGFTGTIYSSHVNLLTIEKQHIYELENRNMKKKEEIGVHMIQSLYSLQKMNDGLINTNLVSFKEESYTISANARIYFSQDVVDLYDQVLKEFFEEKLYNGEKIESKLIPAIRKDLGINA
ncbi:hypothetical protein [Facklamia sp. P12950]|uniref:hypothetical protein n=1 Tax=Facklamia sp. P12950 TaxID=3421951 RepID=UPI003D17DBE9